MTPARFRVIVADPPWAFDDRLDQMKAATPRSAASNYPTLDQAALKELPIDLLAEDDAVLALWTPCSLLAEGLDLMRAWGFRQVQEWTWVKLTTQRDDEVAVSSDGQIAIRDAAALRALAGCARKADRVQVAPSLDHQEVVVDLPLAFGMGRLARSAKESCLIGVRGSPYKHLKNKSIRDVFFAEAGPHSQKPECVQDALDVMFPGGQALELFARRQRDSFPDDDRWTRIGNEAPATMGEDIRDSVKRLLGEVKLRCRVATKKDFGRRGLLVLDNGVLTHTALPMKSVSDHYVLDAEGDHEFPASIDLRRALRSR